MIFNYLLYFLLLFFFIPWDSDDINIKIPKNIKVIYLNKYNFDQILKGDWTIYINFQEKDMEINSNSGILNINTFDDCFLATYFNVNKLNSKIHIRNGVIVENMKIMRSDMLMAIDFYIYLCYLKFKSGFIKYLKKLFNLNCGRLINIK